MENLKGGCLCGAVRYELLGAPRASAVCHCIHCKKQSGSMFSFNLIIKESDYRQEGMAAVYVDVGDSGNPVHRYFCGLCGSPIFARIAAAPGKIILKAGTLDMIPDMPPQTEIYCDRAASWLPPIRDTARFAANL